MYNKYKRIEKFNEGNNITMRKGGFTLPGESGYEQLTLMLAKKWGADVIRDSDGTTLSDEIINAGYGIYSTICIIRDHNDWARQNMDKLQQTFLCTPPVVAVVDEVVISLMDSFYKEQFMINDSESAMKYWEVYDRTTNELIERTKWEYNQKNGRIIVKNIIPFHKYTASFLVYRIWEEISMYNHTTNNWNKEHLMQIDPRYNEAQEYLLTWLENWCITHQETTVVRFTSMFYNFVWVWGSSSNNRNLFTDWASYDYTVSVLALEDFEKKYGYRMTAEDFINKGNFHVTHMPGNSKKYDWMAFINDFVIEFGKKLIDLVHKYNKKAYVFYDDSWVGIEPYNGRFQEFEFDGLIKCVFSGYEARLCADAPVPVHELRLHPYLFPVGLGGAPTFAEGGDPTLDAKKYWTQVRRALLRCKIDRIGLGGYLHLVEQFPDFSDYIEKVADEFRLIRDLHDAGGPYNIKTRLGILHSWGKLRSWTLSGHFHETKTHDLIHINEALSGLPIKVSFISFDDVKLGALDQVDVVINAGSAGTAWSGGDCWRDEELITVLTEWVYKGGAFIGVNEPSAVDGYDNYFRMSHVLGVDKDTGAKVCHGRWTFEAADEEKIIPDGTKIAANCNCFLTDEEVKVLSADGNMPLITMKGFGKGKGIYLSTFQLTQINTRMLYQLVRYAGGEGISGKYVTDNIYTECAYYPDSKKLIVINNSDILQISNIPTEAENVTVTLEPYETKFIDISAQ